MDYNRKGGKGVPFFSVSRPAEEKGVRNHF